MENRLLQIQIRGRWTCSVILPCVINYSLYMLALCTPESQFWTTEMPAVAVFTEVRKFPKSLSQSPPYDSAPLSWQYFLYSSSYRL